jgi:hypothetical protein
LPIEQYANNFYDWIEQMATTPSRRVIIFRTEEQFVMDTARIRMTDPYGPSPRNVFTDFDWIHRHESELLQQYGERHIIVYHEQVIGVGDTYAAAIQDAEANVAPDSGEITPVHKKLHYKIPFSRIRLTPT